MESFATQTPLDGLVASEAVFAVGSLNFSPFRQHSLIFIPSRKARSMVTRTLAKVGANYNCTVKNCDPSSVVTINDPLTRPNARVNLTPLSKTVDRTSPEVQPGSRRCCFTNHLPSSIHIRGGVVCC